MPAVSPYHGQHSPFGPYAGHAGDPYDTTPVHLVPGDRIGGRPANSRRKRLLRTCLVAAVVAGGGWVWRTYPETVVEWSAAVATVVTPLLESKPPVSSSRMPLAPPLQQASFSEPPTAMAPPQAEFTPPVARTIDAKAPEAPVETTPAPEPLPPPAADPADPYQAKALAVGLHPGLSRVLLASLTAVDYRNAGLAISTALAETPDTAIHEWPRERAAKLARFQVKFVTGAPEDCRRYVVMVSKNGWLTTALPMEKCGVRRRTAVQR